MNTTNKLLAKTLAGLAMLATLAGCSTMNAGSTAADAAPLKVAFGEFRLVTNGVEASLGHGLLTGDAGFHIVSEDTGDTFVGKVRKQGQFDMRLQPGAYRVSTVFFKHQGETIEADTNFRFEVAADADSTYVGSIGLEATLESSNYGVVGTADRFTVANECAEDCAPHMATLGLTQGETSVSLFQWESRIASTD